jgi:hypothetical protein
LSDAFPRQSDFGCCLLQRDSSLAVPPEVPHTSSRGLFSASPASQSKQFIFKIGCGGNSFLNGFVASLPDYVARARKFTEGTREEFPQSSEMPPLPIRRPFPELQTYRQKGALNLIHPSNWNLMVVDQ